MREDNVNGADEDVRTALRVGSSDMPPGIDLLRSVRGQQAPARRPRFRVRALVSAAVIAAIGAAVALGLTLTATVAEAPSALAVVLAAEAKISTESYRFSEQLVTTQTPTGAPRVLSDIEGSFDPARAVGEESIAGVREAPILFIGPHLYMPIPIRPGTSTHGKRYVETGMAPPSWPAAPGDRPVDPAVLLKLFRSFASVRAAGPASGPGWTGTKYTFTVNSASFKRAQGFEGETGTVYVDNQGRVRRVITVTRIRLVVSQFREGKPAGKVVLKFTLTNEATFGDFNCVVKVKAPPPSEVYKS